MKNKRGISQIVAVVLIIIITISTFSIIASFTLSFVKNNLEKAKTCEFNKEYLKINDLLDFNCYDESEGVYKISIESASEDLEGFNIIFIKGTQRETINVKSGNPPDTEFTMLDGSTIEIPEEGETLTYKYSSTEDYDSIKVYPTISNNVNCDFPAEKNLVKCQ